MMQLETRRKAAQGLKPGGCLKMVASRSWAVYLRRLRDGRWAVLCGWRTEEGFGDDALSQRPVAGLEGSVHEARDYDFGDNFNDALSYYGECIAACSTRRVPRKLNLPPAQE